MMDGEGGTVCPLAAIFVFWHSIYLIHISVFTGFHFHSLSEFVLCGLFLPEWILLQCCYPTSWLSLLQF